MKKLNLVDKLDGIPYQKIVHSDKQVDIIIGMVDCTEEVWIHSRMNSYEDLLVIKLAANALRGYGIPKINLFVPCFLHQRDDRQFVQGQSFGLWEVCAEVKSIGFSTIAIFHPHSDVLPALLYTRTNKVEVMSNKVYIQQAIFNIRDKHKVDPILVSPDAGAYKWVYKLGENLNLPVVTGNKCRIGSDIKVDIHGDVKGKICLILDDYADGARTFVTLAEELKRQGASYVYLYISHSLFSNGLDTVKKVIDGVYTTNSIGKVEASDFMTIFKVI